MDAIFHSFKKAIDGTNDRWDHVSNLTHDEARDATRFPYGGHVDEKTGRKYIWTYAIMPRHVPESRSSLAGLGSRRAPIPSVAGAIMSKLAKR